MPAALLVDGKIPSELDVAGSTDAARLWQTRDLEDD
jgi:hypothetical protein